MSAAELRKAAETLRDAARRVARHAPAPWARGGTEDCGCCPAPLLVDGDGEAIIDAWQVSGDEATYIAAMHPGVGLALADWLEDSSALVADQVQQDWPALVIARLVNGTCP